MAYYSISLKPYWASIMSEQKIIDLVIFFSVFAIGGGD